MTTHIKEQLYQLVAGEDLIDRDAIHRAVSIAGTITPTARLAIGVLKSKCLSGNHAAVCYEGITKLPAAAAIGSAGAPLTVTTSGWFTGATSGQYTIGRSLSTAASGDIFAAMVDFKSIKYLAT